MINLSDDKNNEIEPEENNYYYVTDDSEWVSDDDYPSADNQILKPKAKKKHHIKSKFPPFNNPTS